MMWFDIYTFQPSGKGSSGLLPVIRAVALGAVTIFLFACNPVKEPEPESTSKPINIAGYYWPGSYWIDIANHKGWFTQKGLNVKIVDTNANYFASFQDLVDGKLDAVEMTMYDFVHFNTQGHELVAVIVLDYSNGADAVIARPGIREIRDLKGKKIAMQKNTLLEYAFSVIAQRNSLPLNQVEIVDLTLQASYDEYLKGNLDAIFLYGPLISSALENVKGSTRLFSTADIPGLSGAVLCFRKEFVQKRRREVQKIVRTWKRTTFFIQRHPDEAYGIVAQVNQKSLEEVREFAKIVKTLDLRDNALAFSFASGFDSVHGTMRQINGFLIEKGTTTKRLDTMQIVDTSFIRNLNKE